MHDLKKLAICFIWLLFFQFSCQAPSDSSNNILHVKVTKVSDGDTFHGTNESGKLKFRLVEIDCPEKDQDYGWQATAFTTGLIFGKTIKVQQTGTDRYGRVLCRVYLDDGSCLNELLVKNGFAWHYKRYSDNEKLARLEIQAKESRIGLWKQDNPAPPWQFRKDHQK